MDRPPAPRLRRIAKVIAIDLAQRIALNPLPTSHPAWVLPQQARLSAETYMDAVNRLCHELFPAHPTRIGTVTGRRWAPTPGASSLRTEVRFYIVRVDAEPADESSGSRILWAPRAVLGLWLDQAESETAGVLIDGYLDGWLPDGPITLD